MLTARIFLAGNKYNSEAKKKLFYDSLFGRVSAIPGVKAVGGIMNLPMSGYRATWNFDIEGKSKPDGVMNYADYEIATPKYFSVMRLPLQEGRLFSSAENTKSELVVIINRTMAREFWPRGRGHRNADQD